MPGMAGYEEYMSWVKQEVIGGHRVTIAILMNGGSDPQYDHEVAVIKGRDYSGVHGLSGAEAAPTIRRMHG
jgi:hypothetical protein